MARTKVHSHRLTSLYVKPLWAEHLERIAADRGVTISHLMREALEDYFKKRKLPV